MFGGTYFGMVLCFSIVHAMLFIKKYIVNCVSISFFLWIVKEHHHHYPYYLIKLQTHTQYVLCDVWCVMCEVPGLFFVRSWLFESRGDQKYAIWVVSGLLSDSPKLAPGGSNMYTLTCKAFYPYFFGLLGIGKSWDRQLLTPLILSPSLDNKDNQDDQDN